MGAGSQLGGEQKPLPAPISAWTPLAGAWLCWCRGWFVRADETGESSASP